MDCIEKRANLKYIQARLFTYLTTQGIEQRLTVLNISPGQCPFQLRVASLLLLDQEHRVPLAHKSAYDHGCLSRLIDQWGVLRLASVSSARAAPRRVHEAHSREPHSRS